MSVEQDTGINEDICHARIIHPERIETAHGRLPSSERIERLAQLYKILGDPTRLKIVMALGATEMCVCDLAALLCMSESAVSHQLRRLRDRSIVTNRRDGQVLYYRLCDVHIDQILRMGMQHVDE